MISQQLGSRAHRITYVPVHVNDHTYVLTIVDKRADIISRVKDIDHIVPIWFASKTPPPEEVRDVLETAGFALELPHGSVL